MDLLSGNTPITNHYSPITPFGRQAARACRCRCAALTAGITFSAINSIERRASFGSAQSWPAVEQRAEIADPSPGTRAAGRRRCDAAAMHQLVEHVVDRDGSSSVTARSCLKTSPAPRRQALGAQVPVSRSRTGPSTLLRVAPRRGVVIRDEDALADPPVGRDRLAVRPARSLSRTSASASPPTPAAGSSPRSASQPRAAAAATPFECGTTTVTTMGGCGFW